MQHQRTKIKTKGIIFDLDGTLVDSRLDFNRMRDELGFPAGVPILEFIQTFEDPIRRRNCLDVVHRHEMEGARQASWYPGAEKVVAQLQQLGVPTGILTRNMREAVELTLSRLQIQVEDVITREDCPPKPDPAGLLMIADRWKLPPGNCIYVGDFVFDIQAARNAGMQSWLFRNGPHSAYEVEADQVFGHFDHFLPLLNDQLDIPVSYRPS